MSTCPVCGRVHLIVWPQFWPYRRGARLFCSEDCLIVYVTQQNFSKYKGVRKKMARLKKDGTPAKKPGRKPNKIEIPEPVSGGKWEKMDTPEDMQVVKGPVTPDELYEEFGKDGWTELPPVETPEASTLGDAINGMADAAADFFGECENMGLNMDRAIHEEDFETTAVRNKNLGEFYFDHDRNCIDWRNGLGDEVSLSPAGWKMMIDTLPKILKMLGVDV